MDRDALDRFIRSKHRTFRWNDGHDYGNYEGVETRDEGLLWFRWSHHPDGGGGMHDTHTQSFEAFLSDGPPRDIPEDKLTQLQALVQELSKRDDDAI